MSILEALGVAVLGIIVVMAVLAILAILITLMSKIVGSFAKSVPVESAPVVATQAPAAPAAVLPEKQSAGRLVLINTDEPTAAMLMAIVADNLQEPLNRLHFKSIKCLEETL